MQAVATIDGSGEPAESAGALQRQQPIASAEPKINLGLDGSLFRPRLSDVPPKARPRRDVGAELTRELNASLLADDVQRGHARGNVLLGDLNTAVRTEGPSSGDAIIRVTVNSQGELSGLELLSGTTSDWSRALQSFRQQAKRKRVRVPTGAQGLRVTYSVSTKIQRPSGKEVETAALGVRRPSLAPNGMTLMGDFDLADLSNKSSRMASSRVLAEEVL